MASLATSEAARRAGAHKTPNDKAAAYRQPLPVASDIESSEAKRHRRMNPARERAASPQVRARSEVPKGNGNGGSGVAALGPPFFRFGTAQMRAGGTGRNGRHQLHGRVSAKDRRQGPHVDPV